MTVGGAARRLIDRIRDADPLLLLLVGAAAAYFAYAYVVDPGRPGEFTPPGWFGEADQGKYVLMAHQLSDFGLTAAAFGYGPGYPVTGVPALWLGFDYDPFAFFDGLAFLVVIWGTYVIASRLFSRAVAAVAGFGVLFASPLVLYFVKPWNSTVSILAGVVILLLATSPRPRPWHPYVMGVMVGWGFAARYIDVVWLGALAGVAILVRSRGRARVGALAAAAACAVLVAIPVLYAQQKLFGSWLDTPYSLTSRPDAPGSDQALSAYHIENVPESFFGVFVSPFLRGARQGGSAVFQVMFWALLAIPGAVIALRRGRPFRPLIATWVIASCAATVFYLAFRGSGAGSPQFGGLHYFKMWWPGYAILAAAAIVTVARRPGRRGR